MQKRGLNTSLFEHKGSVLPDEIHGVLQQYDVGVLTHGFTGGYGEIEYQTIFPTRTIPLLLSGKPIFAHSPKGSFLNSFLEEHKCATLVDDADISKIMEGLDQIADNEIYQTELVENAIKTANLFFGPNVTAELMKCIETN